MANYCHNCLTKKGRWLKGGVHDCVKCSICNMNTNVHGEILRWGGVHHGSCLKCIKCGEDGDRNLIDILIDGQEFPCHEQCMDCEICGKPGTRDDHIRSVTFVINEEYVDYAHKSCATLAKAEEKADAIKKAQDEASAKTRAEAEGLDDAAVEAAVEAAVKAAVEEVEKAYEDDSSDDSWSAASEAAAEEFWKRDEPQS